MALRSPASFVAMCKILFLSFVAQLDADEKQGEHYKCGFSIKKHGDDNTKIAVHSWRVSLEGRGRSGTLPGRCHGGLLLPAAARRAAWQTSVAHRRQHPRQPGVCTCAAAHTVHTTTRHQFTRLILMLRKHFSAAFPRTKPKY